MRVGATYLRKGRNAREMPDTAPKMPAIASAHWYCVCGPGGIHSARKPANWMPRVFQKKKLTNMKPKIVTRWWDSTSPDKSGASVTIMKVKNPIPTA